MQKFLFWLPSIIFNIAEFLLVILCGIALKIELHNIIMIILSFVVIRLSIGLPKHYKSWQKCLIWTVLVFNSLFILERVDITISLLLTTFTAIILSGHADIRDTFMWQRKGESKYTEELEHVKYNPADPRLIAFEERLKADNDNFTLMCYQYIFKQRLTWQETADKLDTETYKLAPTVEKIAFGIRVYCIPQKVDPA